MYYENWIDNLIENENIWGYKYGYYKTMTTRRKIKGENIKKMKVELEKLIKNKNLKELERNSKILSSKYKSNKEKSPDKNSKQARKENKEANGIFPKELEEENSYKIEKDLERMSAIIGSIKKTPSDLIEQDGLALAGLALIPALLPIPVEVFTLVDRVVYVFILVIYFLILGVLFYYRHSKSKDKNTKINCIEISIKELLNEKRKMR